MKCDIILIVKITLNLFMRFRQKKTNKNIKIIIPVVLVIVLLAGLLGYYFMQEPEPKPEPENNTNEEASEEVPNKVYYSNDIIEYGPLIIKDKIPMPSYNSHSVEEHVSAPEKEELNEELEAIKEKIKEVEKGSDEYSDLLERKEELEYKLFKINVGVVRATFENTSDRVVTIGGEYTIKDRNNKVIESYSLQPSENSKGDDAGYMERLQREEGIGGEKIRPGEEKVGYLFHNQEYEDDLILELDLFDDLNPIDIKLYLVNLGF
jgi:flagellar basal body-associated protein FliL